eukprot:TRINITY_DN1324_c7_g1_i1.p1 TRINITY_DN1324_c7_g1~~TRINITY_DN1324_c7_g1_i1.p1  ORF type:complete len:58 (+),score=4.59 TRINITY_DN1324_c7_g1_i1:478-651(+)
METLCFLNLPVMSSNSKTLRLFSFFSTLHDPLFLLTSVQNSILVRETDQTTEKYQNI